MGESSAVCPDTSSAGWEEGIVRLQQEEELFSRSVVSDSL